MDTSTRLNTLERWLIVLPLAAGLVFGLFPLLFPAFFASFTGFAYNDPFISRIAGAATLGYAIGLALGLRQGTWGAVRLMIIAVLTFNLASIYVCIAQIIHPDTIGGARPIVYLIFATSIGFVVLTAALLYRHRQEAKMMPNIASWIPIFIILATILAAFFGLQALFFPTFLRLFGLKATNFFLYGQAGAATFGYAVMGIFELRSRNWQELRNPFVMAAIFNGASFLASFLTIALGESLVFPLLIAVASLAVTIASIVALRTNGGTASSAPLAAPIGRT